MLVERIAGGDAEALGDLYDRYGRVAFGMLYRMLPGPEAAEEVAQDAFHAVWRRASSYRPERGAVRTWLLAICRNAAIDWRRTRGKRSEREVSIDTAADLIADGRVDERVVDALREERVRELAQFEEALYEAAAVGAARADPPRDLRARIVLRHRGTRARRESDWGGARARAWLARPVPLALPLALAVFLVVSFVAVGTARREADAYARALAGVADGRGGALAAQTDAPPDARGALVIPRSGDPYVVLELSSPPN